jgi:hypothetical protein
LRQELSRTGHQKGQLEKEVGEQRREITNHLNEAEQHRRRIEELENEIQGQEGRIARQASKIEDLRRAKEKYEDELKRSTEANEAQKKENAELEDEIKAMTAKEESLKEDVGRLKEAIRQRAAKSWKQFPPSVKKGEQFEVPDGIIAHLTSECGGNVHDRQVVDIPCGSFEKETNGASPHSGAYDGLPECAAKNVADLETDSRLRSACRGNWEDIMHTRNNWVCYDFKERKIVPTHYAIRTNWEGPHLKSWLVETSVDGEIWPEVARMENNEQLNGRHFTGTFAAAGGRECRFIRLVNVGRNHWGWDDLRISAWETFGSLLE